jgi:hypothetical protein
MIHLRVGVELLAEDMTGCNGQRRRGGKPGFIVGLCELFWRLLAHNLVEEIYSRWFYYLCTPVLFHFR